MNAVKEKAYAKINLFIDVLAKREDGFHDISTVMHSVSLADEITVTLNSFGKRNVRMVLDGNKRLPTDGKNLAVCSAELFLSRALIDADVTVRLTKRIPVSAGLAGGSTDAAAVLRAMNKLFSRPFADKALVAMAASLGSDVPYCMKGGTALCSGRGEQITRLDGSLMLHTVIAVAHEHVSTPRAYAALDSLYSDFSSGAYAPRSVALAGLVESVRGGALPDGELYNIFEDAVLPACPGASALRARMPELGATHSLMSGSGPSVFGIFPGEAEARRAEQLLRSEGVTAYYAKTV